MMDTLGRYKILSTIGQGAMGMVYKAIDPMIDRTVAIKAIHLTLNDEEMAEYEARFQQEIKAVGRLNHPNIVTIYDVGRSGNITYMAMEFLEGRELSDILADPQRPSIAQCVGWIIQIAQGLELAHEHEIVHRDVKPSNIMVVRGDFAKITDFGIARMPASAVKTMTGMILGSPRYMSPEQVTGADLDHRTDIFSLGVVLYEALAGRWPFDGSNITAIMYSTVNLVPAPPSSINGEVPVMLDLIVAKALAKSTEDRYQSMRELAHDLIEVQRQLSVKSSAPQVFAATAPRPANPAPKDVVKPAPYQAPNDHDETGHPLKLSKAFDSFEATVKLAALTNQTTDFSHYISETQKMRKYQAAPGDADTGVATQRVFREPASRPPPAAASVPVNPSGKAGDHVEDLRPADSAAASPAPILPIVALVILAVLAIVLTIALVAR